MEPLHSRQVYGAPLAWATFHYYQAELDSCADWVERGIAERHPAMFFFLRCHAHALLASDRWQGLAKLLNLHHEFRQATEMPRDGERG
jgi:hypothetical protein